ncbi:hypothetical protein EON67_06235 [archaeon]|nr:MAG: hypothetical protein EON67_06235 [archaeon]
MQLHSPQFRQALSTMTGALDSGNLPAVCAMFGLSFEDAAAAPGANGDTTAMLIAAIQASVRRANAAAEPAAGTRAAGTPAADTVVVETAADAAAAPTGTSEGESKAGAQQ